MTLNLIAGSATIAEPSTTTLTILDDDTTPPGALHFSADAYAVLESSGLVTATVRRSGGTADQVQVGYETSDGSAMAGSDYEPVAGTLTFAEGETEQTLTVTLRDDPGAEGSETFTVVLRDVVGVARLGEPSMTTVTLLDDEKAVRVLLPAVLR